MKESVLLLLLLSLCMDTCCNQSHGTTQLNTLFLQSVFRDMDKNGTLSYDQLDSFVTEESQAYSHPDPRTTPTLEKESSEKNNSCVAIDNATTLMKCMAHKCLTLSNVLELYGFQSTPTFNMTSIQAISPGLLYMITQSCSSIPGSPDMEHTGTNTPLAVWGYGILFVTLINLCSLVGVIVLPFMKMAIYKQILIFMVALAVGALAGSGLLFLIPEAFGLVHESHGNMDYIFKACTIMGGIYLFYLTERIMRILTDWKERRNLKRKNPSVESGQDDAPSGLMDIICSVKKNTPVNQDQLYKDASTLPRNVSSSTQQELLDKSSDDSTYGHDNNMVDVQGDEKYEDSMPMKSHGDGQHTIKPLAWMIIFGDGLHNFIDGLSIGTAFTQSTLSGISVSLAVMCEELPHELGDFAILLNCGMTVKKALMYNFLSACMCYMGLVIGILLGENASSHDWVFAVAGGMFLYISLADMMPEMNSASEGEGSRRYGTSKIFILQNVGLMTGFGIMVILAIYGSKISLV
ncbi:metal cation symporter ZIP14-like [Haliotis rubra]|uniref:metal cation symporter ZIP14-like n=1 Tax=Haliotis rubra TaxID=36100 RepID=UPI001EE5E559|nr:metal cation symporter ZIP14-like [Haliotis rubra]